MNTVSDPVPQELVHTRTIAARGFLRRDGLWSAQMKTFTVAEQEKGGLLIRGARLKPNLLAAQGVNSLFFYGDSDDGGGG